MVRPRPIFTWRLFEGWSSSSAVEREQVPVALQVVRVRTHRAIQVYPRPGPVVALGVGPLAITCEDAEQRKIAGAFVRVIRLDAELVGFPGGARQEGQRLLAAGRGLHSRYCSVACFGIQFEPFGVRTVDEGIDGLERDTFRTAKVMTGQSIWIHGLEHLGRCGQVQETHAKVPILAHFLPHGAPHDQLRQEGPIGNPRAAQHRLLAGEELKAAVRALYDDPAAARGKFRQIHVGKWILHEVSRKTEIAAGKIPVPAPLRIPLQRSVQVAAAEAVRAVAFDARAQ